MIKKLLILFVCLHLLILPSFAVTFDGADDSISTDASIGITGSTNRTIALRYRADSLNGSLVSHGTDIPGGLFNLKISGSAGKVAVVVGTGFRVWLFPDVIDGEWHHLAVVLDGTNVSDVVAYGDGALLSVDSTVAHTVNTSASVLSAGTRLGDGVTEPLDGSISEIAMWSVALSAEEVLSLASSQLERFPLQIQSASLRACFSMDDGPDGTSADGDSFLNLSLQSNNATGDDGGNNTGLIWEAEEVSSYP